MANHFANLKSGKYIKCLVGDGVIQRYVVVVFMSSLFLDLALGITHNRCNNRRN